MGVLLSAAGMLLGAVAWSLSNTALFGPSIALAILGVVVVLSQMDSKRGGELAELRGEVQTLRGLGGEVVALREEVALLRERA